MLSSFESFETFIKKVILEKISRHPNLFQGLFFKVYISKRARFSKY